LPKTNDIDLNIDFESVLAKINVTVPLKEIIKIPSMRSRFERFFKVPSEPVDPPIMLQANHFRMQYDEHPPFFMALQVNNKRLNNCMLDSGAGANMMSLKVMRQLGLETTRPYRNVCGIESRAIPTHGVVENVKVHLARYPEIVLLIDIVVVDVPDVWGMLLSRKFVAMLGGTLQMDLTGINIPMDDGTYAHLPNMPMKRLMLKRLTLTPRQRNP
jgi:hypothetical protein